MKTIEFILTNFFKVWYGTAWALGVLLVSPFYILAFVTDLFGPGTVSRDRRKRIHSPVSSHGVVAQGQSGGLVPPTTADEDWFSDSITLPNG